MRLGYKAAPGSKDRKTRTCYWCLAKFHSCSSHHHQRRITQVSKMGITIMPPCPIPCLLLAAIIPLGALINVFTFLFRPISCWRPSGDGRSSSTIRRRLQLAEQLADEADDILLGPAPVFAPILQDFQARVPCFLYESPLDAHMQHDDDGSPCTCAVCLSELVPRQDEVRQLPLCRHVFHTSCIDEWVRHRHGDCPLCRASLIHFKTLDHDLRQQQHAGTSISRVPDLTVNVVRAARS